MINENEYKSIKEMIDIKLIEDVRLVSYELDSEILSVISGKNQPNLYTTHLLSVLLFITIFSKHLDSI